MGTLETPQVSLFFRSPPAINKVCLSRVAVVTVMNRDERIEGYPLLAALEYIQILLFRDSVVPLLHLASRGMITRIVQAGNHDVLAVSHGVVVEHQAQRMVP